MAKLQALLLVLNWEVVSGQWSVGELGGGLGTHTC